MIHLKSIDMHGQKISTHKKDINVVQLTISKKVEILWLSCFLSKIKPINITFIYPISYIHFILFLINQTKKKKVKTDKIIFKNHFFRKHEP